MLVTVWSSLIVLAILLATRSLAWQGTGGFVWSVVLSGIGLMFVWRGAPFAFHMRRNVRDRVFGRHDQSLEEPDLAAVLTETQKGGPWLGWRLDPAVR